MTGCSTPLVSCIMPTANRRRFVPFAIAQFLAQDYANAEFVILDDGEETVGDLVPAHPAVRYLHAPRHRNLGAKRNAACEAARGDIILHWDDDDWYAPNRVRLQVEALCADGADLCGINRVFFFDPRAPAAWEYVYPAGGAPWVYGATLCYRRDYWRARPFGEMNVGEDTCFAAASRSHRLCVLPDNRFFVALVHPGNTSPKHVRDPRWQPRPIETIRAITGGGWPDLAAVPAAPPATPADGAAAPAPAKRPGAPARSMTAGTALVAAAYGIGDLIRISPLIRVLAQQGHRVDFLIAADYADSAELFRGAPEINRVIVHPSPASRAPAPRIAEIGDATYELAIFAHLAAPLAARVPAKRHVICERERWLSEGDYACAQEVARELGWQQAMPLPFAVPSSRRFDLPDGTIVLHPGCKPDWPWKRWHGFADLAARLPNVAIIGSEADNNNVGTYFHTRHTWPAHARDYTGTLNLADTAALIAQSAALVSNDSGMMHLAVAVGTPTFGIFGITNPEREIIPAPHMRVITKGLPCEPGCRREAWGRRDCEHHLECLKTLSADEVAARIETELPSMRRSVKSAEAAAPEKIRLNYYAGAFDASGYGQAARMYIRALHAAGVKVSVIDTGARPAQVQDAEVAALLGSDPDADFHLFHGIPPYWARMAFQLRNVIAMTVWETDKMPDQWRSALVHAVDVWLPCSFNVDVFERPLGRTPFRLPHAAPASCADGALPANVSLDLAPADFVFYSIFEWQERKNPDGIIEAFLRAFPEKNDAVLLLKSSSAAAKAAAATLADLRGRTSSRGRVILCCEAWDEATINALHSRGDCYVSLHKGEGWGYPLFEATCRGTPVVATAYSGPLDYLDADHHWLVRCTTASVRQRYAYYHPGMRWAEPDLTHASEGLAWVYHNRDTAKHRAAAAARELRAKFSVERVGALAKERLMELRQRVAAASVASIRHDAVDRRPPGLPIPGRWFDADYFEHGLKSNWERGYRWQSFKGIFEDASAYLAEMFPDARSFLDVGCAKGFLVRTLRARGLEAWGFDHSPWAIERAETAAKPFLRLADAATADYDRQFDVVVAMSILESLTEEQLEQLLPRARAWARQALFAVVATRGAAAAASTVDRDLAHITMRERDWWIDRFQAAGWHRDAIHCRFERECQRHRLPQRMGWDVFVFSPGNNVRVSSGAREAAAGS